MLRRLPVIALLGALAFTAACTNKKVSNPLANVGSKQPDKVLFDRAMADLKHNRFDVARLTLQTLINTYPDSEFIARAKLGVADSWYAEGGTAALQQAEIEYKDFETFFPNMAEAAEAQLKIANIHYQQMEKPDRDYTHALRAEEEYRNLILQYPDSKLVPQAKQRLLQVQEVLAEREFRVGRFYYLRSTYPAAIARLKSVADEYPLYSKADEALYLLGQAYEGEIAVIRANSKLKEVAKAAAIKELTDGAAAAYSRILTRYPVMDRADDAKQRLAALRRPIPRATRAAIAQNKAEEDGRRDRGMVAKVMGNFSKHPDVSQAAKVGEPTLVDPQMLSASEVVRQTTSAMTGAVTGGGNNTVSVETVGTGTPPANQAAPRSDNPAVDPSVTATDPAAAGDPASATPAGADPAGAGNTTADPNELKPNVHPDPNELKPNVPDSGSTAPLPPPQQINEIQNGTTTPAPAAAGTTGQASDSASSTGDQQTGDQPVASSKHKKKKGLKKIIPF
jgi:outer membrane protein assembly factor BamD